MTETTNINPLDALLASDMKQEKQVYIKRLNTYFTIRGLDGEEFKDCRNEATFYTGSGKNRKPDVDQNILNVALVSKACVNPDFKDAKVLEKFKAKTGADAVAKALLAGESLTLMKEIMQISGFDNDIDEVKN